LSWLLNFFSDRTHQTKINSSLSEPQNLLGVIQGSGIGPIMSVMFINDLVDALNQFGVCVKLFADDVKVYIRVLNNCDVQQLQRALDALANWEDVWQLSRPISVSKCSVVNIGKSSVPLSSLHIRNNVLNITKIGIDLGITVIDDLKPRAHINSAVTKAHQRANAILLCFLSRNIDMLKSAFIVYVRPFLEYNSVVWSPYYKQDIEAIERVQRRFSKRSRGLKEFTYEERLKFLGWPTLEFRRLNNDLLWSYKILFGLVHLNSDHFFKLSPNQTRGHGFKLYKQFSSSNADNVGKK